MEMTEAEKVRAWELRVLARFTWSQITRILFPEAYDEAPEPSTTLLANTVAHWYKTDKRAQALCWERARTV